MKSHFDTYFNDHPHVKRYGQERPVWVYDFNWNLLGVCASTNDCADFFDKDVTYIYSAIYNGNKIKRKGYWYRVLRHPKN